MAARGDVSLAHHAHLFPESFNDKGTVDVLLRYLDECSIEQAVCFAPFAHQFKDPDFNCNRWLSGAIKGKSRLHGFGTLNFHKNMSDQVREIADLGFKGVKVHPPAQELNILSKPARDAYEIAQELNLFLTFHTGIHHHRLKEARVVDWDEIAFDFPKLRFSMEHVGGWAFFNEALAVLANHVPPPWEKKPCNVFAGLTSVFSPVQLPFWFMSPERMHELIRQAGINQVIFGLDFPYNDVEATKRGIEMIKALGLSEEDTAKILGGNLKRELKIV